jgi:hypothetical protein
MRQYNGELGSKGFSLVELIIGMAVLLTTSLGFMMLLTEMSGTVASLENRSNTDTVFQRVRMYLTNEAVCTRTFVQLSDKTNGLSSSRYSLVISESGTVLLQQGDFVDAARKVTFDGIDLLNVNTHKNDHSDQDLSAQVVFKVVGKNNAVKYETRNISVRFKWSGSYICETAETDAKEGVLVAACTALGGSYDAGNCYSSDGTTVPVALDLACARYCDGWQDFISLGTEKTTTYTLNGKSKLCTCVGRKPCSCVPAPGSVVAGFRYADTCGRAERCIGVRDDCYDTEAVKYSGKHERFGVFPPGQNQACIGADGKEGL